MEVLPLTHQQWIDHVKWITRVELKRGYKFLYGKLKSKTQRKREKLLNQQGLKKVGDVVRENV